MVTRFDESARVALAAIVADDDLGRAVLSDPAALSAVLTPYLPDSPRETGPLLAAAQANVAGMLREHVARGMDTATAIRITAANLATRTAFSAEASLWVTGEMAIALGLTSDDRMPPLAPPGAGTDLAAAAEFAGPAPTSSSVTAQPGHVIPTGKRKRSSGGRAATV